MRRLDDLPEYAMLFDQRQCIGCNACVVACQQGYDLPAENQLNWVHIRESGHFPNVRIDFKPFLCGQCEGTPCIDACPVPGATYQREDKVVLVDEETCIGCHACVHACPFGARSMNTETNKVVKCTFCIAEVKAGESPFCVKTCPTDARMFVDLESLSPEEEAQLANAKRMDPIDGAHPRVYYVS